MMGCEFCGWWERVSQFTGICGCPDGKNCGEYTGVSESCGKWIKKAATVQPTKKEPKKYEPTQERLDPSFLIEFVRQNSIFDADLLAKIIEEWKQFKQIGTCGECEHWEEQIAYCELNSYFVDHEGLCCSPAESPNWTMWEPNEFCSRFKRRIQDGPGESTGTD